MKHANGSPHSASVPVAAAPTMPNLMRGPQKGVVLATHLVGEVGNRRSLGVECVVMLYADRRILRNVPVEQRGGYDAVSVWIPRPVASVVGVGDVLAFDVNGPVPQWLESSSMKDMDGDHVVVDFFNGDPNDPIVRGARPHPRSTWTPTASVVSTLRAFARIAEGTTAAFEYGTALRVRIGANVDIAGVEVNVSGTAVAITGDEVSIAGGPVSVTGSTVSVTATGDVTVDGETVNLNGGDKGVARLDDEVQTDPNDATLNTEWQLWFSKVHTVASAIDPTLVLPTSPIKGAVTAASETVLAGD